MYKKLKVTISQDAGSFWALPYDLLESFQLKEKDHVLLKFGSADSYVTVQQLPDSTKNSIMELSIKSAKDLMLPKEISVMIKPEEKNQFRLGPIIGILTYRNNVSMGRFWYYKKYALINKNNGFLYVFSGEDINVLTKTIIGYHYDDCTGQWKHDRFPFPDAVIDRIYPNKYSYHNLLENVIGPKIFNKQTRIDKMEFFHSLRSHDFLKQYLPETLLFEETSDLDIFLSKYSQVYLKPVNSHKGMGVVQVKNTKENLLNCKYLKKSRQYVTATTSSNEIFDLLKKTTGRKRPYIVQQGINSMPYNNRAFSIRTWAMKNGYGHWIMPGMDARGAFKNGFLTNISAGSTSILLRNLYKTIISATDMTKDDLLLLLEELTLQTARQLDKDFGPLGLLGLDIMVDRRGKLWLIEANGNPGKTAVLNQQEYFSWPTQVYQYPLAYATHLAGFSENIPSSENQTVNAPKLHNMSLEPNPPDITIDELKINTSVIIVEKAFQEICTTEKIAPPGTVLNRTTGQLITPVNLEVAGEVVFKTHLNSDNLLYEGYIPASLVIGESDAQQVLIPFHFNSQIPGIKACDIIDQEITIGSLSVKAIPYYNTDSYTSEVKLILSVDLNFSVKVSRKCSIAVAGRLIDINENSN